MDFSLIQDLSSWDALAAEWDELYAQSHVQIPFLRFGYLRSWWQTLGGGEWAPSDCQLKIILARESGSLFGIAPLFLSAKPNFQPALRFIGSIEVTDYLDFLVLPDRLEEFLSGLLKFIASSPDLPIKTLELYNLMETSPTYTALQAACAQSAWSFTSQRLLPTPYIPLAENFEAYLASITKKQRHEIRRKLRNAETRHQTAWYTVAERDKLDAEMDAFINMMRHDQRKETFLKNPAMPQFLHDTAHFAFDAGLLHLSFLTFDSHKAAAFMSLLTPEKLWVYNSAWEPAFAPCSPGWVLLAKEIEWVIAHGIREVDMMRGDENYKYKFGGIDRFIAHIICEPTPASLT